MGAPLFAAVPGWTAWIGSTRCRREGKACEPVVAGLRAFAIGLRAHSADFFGPAHWTDWGPSNSRPPAFSHYFLYFLIGVGLGLSGLSTGLLAQNGVLAKHWAGWLLAMVVGYLIGVVVSFVPGMTGSSGNPFWLYVSLLNFVVNCAPRCFGFLALFTRFVTRRRTPVFDSLTANSYGIYIVHYVFVAAIQYALLTEPLPGWAKANVVIVGALATSCIVAMGLRRVPVTAKLVGGREQKPSSRHS